MNHETPAAIYVRVSSEEQTDGHSLDEQQLRCREFCDRRGYRVVAEYVEVESAKNIADRPQFQQMLADARAGRFSVIVCHKLDRFSRDVVDGLSVLKGLTQFGVSFVSASEEFDFTTPVGEMVLTLLLAFARWYRRNLIAETTKGKQGRARKGLTNASVLPFGYRRGEDGHPVPSDDAPIVREMFERYATGAYTDLQIAEWLNSLGKTTSGSWGKRPFSKDTVRAMLINPFYAGWVVYRGLTERENERRERLRQSKRAVKLIPGQHEAIISQELFERCQALRKLRRRAAGRPASNGRVYLLSRLARCAHCGGPLRATRVGRETGYRCTARERGMPCSAHRTHVPQSALLPDLSAIMAQLQLHEGVKADVLRMLEESDPMTEVRRKRERLEGELRRLNRMYQAGTVDDDYFDREAARIKAELAATELQAQPLDIGLAAEMLGDMARLWEQASDGERAEIVRALFERVDVDVDRRQVVGFAPKDEYRPLFRAVFANFGSDGDRILYWRQPPPSGIGADFASSTIDNNACRSPETP